MLYADLLLKTKTKNRETLFLTYTLPPEVLPEVKKGSLVLVNFRGQKKRALLWRFKRTLPSLLKTKALKPILKVLHSKPLLSESQLSLASWISSYYLAPLNEVIFLFIRQNTPNV